MASIGHKDHSFKSHNWTSIRVTTYFLAIISGWTLKNLAEDAYSSFVAFSLVFLHSLFGSIYFTHPTYFFRKAYLFSGVLVQFAGVPLIIADASHIMKYPRLCFCVTIVIVVIWSLAQWLHKNIEAFIVDISVLWNSALLIYVSLSIDESYWTAGLAVLSLMNHFIFRRLSMYYDISHLEVTTISLCFFVIFALKAHQEVQVYARENNSIQQSINNEEKYL